MTKRKEINRVFNPIFAYFIAYDIYFYDYEDSQKLMKRVKLINEQQLIEELTELKALKFQLGLTINIFKDDGATTEEQHEYCTVNKMLY